MNNGGKVIIGLFVVSLLVACTKDAKRTDATDNTSFEVGLLFEHEGCRVYRFYDSGTHIYYTSCGDVQWDKHYSCGQHGEQCVDRKRVTNGGTK
jgi:hypothetical protein